ncbi:ROK family protein [Rubellimicrobium mesophilum DSM 19309]|uniref:ROK family protein n=1 Tax=Rubellimicrobium mesophilum DSM 19309 TaxID=442562 RepID=A0A017HLC1_9RHOB|nr:ROK family protein [Rubellimicrobium mesophilum]EYD74968.1 ROK family protein [Rubellimicrobium mesophilum DSM 19309]
MAEAATLEEAALALDIGGTKILAALVRGAEVLAEVRVPTDPSAGPEGWLARAEEAVAPWAGRYAWTGAAVTGLVDGGRWSALNPGILPIPDGYPLMERLSARLGGPAAAFNDAQAAAWGEHRFGAGQGADMVFLTLSTGIGGGIVLGGRLLLGRGSLAGHFGVTAPVLAEHPAHIEDGIAGRWIAGEAARVGHPVDAEGVFAAAQAGEGWAETIVMKSARRAARLLANIQLMLAPARIVLGGGIGLAPGQIERLRELLGPLPPLRRPCLVPAALGARAGVIGAADLARPTIKNDNQQRRIA